MKRIAILSGAAAVVGVGAELSKAPLRTPAGGHGCHRPQRDRRGRVLRGAVGPHPDQRLPGPLRLLVDAGRRRLGAGCRTHPIGRAIRAWQRTVPSVILLTHVHPDHAGAARELATIWGCPILVHPAEIPIANGDFAAMTRYAGPMDRWLILPLMRPSASADANRSSRQAASGETCARSDRAARSPALTAGSGCTAGPHPGARRLCPGPGQGRHQWRRAPHAPGECRDGPAVGSPGFLPRRPGTRRGTASGRVPRSGRSPVSSRPSLPAAMGVRSRAWVRRPSSGSSPPGCDRRRVKGALTATRRAFAAAAAHAATKGWTGSPARAMSHGCGWTRSPLQGS